MFGQQNVGFVPFMKSVTLLSSQISIQDQGRGGTQTPDRGNRIDVTAA
jgi:hypothetical protein